MSTSRARKQNYRDYAAYGNLAYDLDRVERDEHIRTKKAQPRIKTIESNEIRVRKAEKVSPFAILGFATVAVFMVLVLMSYIQLTEISGDVVAMKSQLSALQSENVSLVTRYEQAFDLAAVETAAEQAGMNKASTGQIYYVDLSSPDTAVVYQTEEHTVLSKLFTSMGHGMYAFVEYFR